MSNDRLLDAAFESFMATGYAKTSMSQIADLAGVSRPTLYRYFPDRDAIFLAVARRLHDQTWDRIDEITADRSGIAVDIVAEAFATKLSAHLEITAASPNGAELLGVNRRIGAELAAESEERMRRLVTSQLRRGETLSVSPARAADFLLILAAGWENELTRSTPARTWKSDVRRSLTALLAGLTVTDPTDTAT